MGARDNGSTRESSEPGKKEVVEEVGSFLRRCAAKVMRHAKS